MYEKEAKELLLLYKSQLNYLRGRQNRFLLEKRYLRARLCEYRIIEQELLIADRIKYNVPNENDAKILKRFKGEK